MQRRARVRAVRGELVRASVAFTDPAAPADAIARPRPLRASCFYEGTVRHRRHGAPRDQFRHRLALAYLDLDELPELFDGHPLWSARRPALAWFRRADYLGDPEQPLSDAVRALVHRRASVEFDGPIRLLTQLRRFGHCFNPVSFYYCFDHDELVRAVVAEVTNTPWGERHAYVLPACMPLAAGDAREGAAEHAPGTVMRGHFGKQLHVSPLMGMDHTYDWRLTEPRERLSVHISSTRHGEREPAFDATLSLRRRELTARELWRVLLRYPAPTLRASARIYAHATGLRLRGAHWYSHPSKHASPA
jgi:uncharacterized protein